MISSDFWRNKNVFITGHTGFKGAWLTLWLLSLGANVYGYSDDIHDEHFLYKSLELKNNEIISIKGDICDFVKLKKSLHESRPDIVVHMAAQSLVRQSYSQPLDNFNINIMGTCNLLEAVRDVQGIGACLVVTTDKCYENLEHGEPFMEDDRLGGGDPYSASKACAEIVTNSYRKSFFQDKSNTAIATVRAGNVIGGGDMSKDRIIPDIIRAYQNDEFVSIRNPQSVRPWQHVLDCLYAYMILCEKLYSKNESYRSAWNIGPEHESIKTVETLLKNFVRHWPETKYKFEPTEDMKESILLTLNTDKANKDLAWFPVLDFEEAISWTANWYREVIQEKKDARIVSLEQLKAYQNKGLRFYKDKLSNDYMDE